MLVLSILVLVSMTLSALGCQCSPDLSPVDMYCRAEFGILVYVQDNGTVTGADRLYRVKLLTAYKLNSQDRNLLDDSRVFTNAEGFACGVILQQGKYYLLSGQYRRDHMKAFFGVLLCSYQEVFDTHPGKTYTPPTCYNRSGK